MSDLSSGLATTANAPAAAPAASPSPADTPPSTPDEALDQVFDAHDAGAAAPPTPAPETPQTPAPAPATGEPSAVDPNAAKPSTDQGPIPFARHTEILKNARVKAQEELAQKVQQEYGGLIQVGQSLRQDFAGTLAQLIEEGLNDPNYGPQLVTMLGRTLASRRGVKQAVDENLEPEPDLQTQDGTPVYSGPQAAKREAWLRKQIVQEMRQEMAPLQQTYQQQQAQLAYDAALEAKAEQLRPTAEQWMRQPYFKEHEAAIRARQRELAASGTEPWAAMGIAYAEIVNTKVLPSLTQQQTQQWLTQAAAKSRGSTSDPAASAPAQPRKPTTPDEALDQIFNAALAGTR